MKYAVVDVETTGVFPTRDRIVEIAIVNLIGHSLVDDEYVTLVNPKRDVGATSIHGIESSHLLDAPTFSEIAGDIMARLQGRVMVGHNARFDESFLAEEFARVGARIEGVEYLCTLQMAYLLEPGGSSRRLAACCARAGLSAFESHSALGDARSTARLFDDYMRRADEERCSEISRRVVSAMNRPFPSWPGAPSPSGKALRREEGLARKLVRRNYLGRLIQSLSGEEAPTAAEAGYLDMLDRALIDRVLDQAESEQLLEEAKRWDLDPARIVACHHLYVRALVNRALEDGIVTASERGDIALVAELLGVSGTTVQTMMEERALPAGAGSVAGRVVCFTGEFRVGRDEATQRAREHGVVIVESVTKKTQLLVAADPESLSGKAGKARKLGIPIISESDFWHVLGS